MEEYTLDNALEDLETLETLGVDGYDRAAAAGRVRRFIKELNEMVIDATTGD